MLPQLKAGAVNEVVWFRREINVPASMAGKQSILKLGKVGDADSVFINGKFIGATGSQYSQRIYKIPEKVLKEGENTIVIRVINYIHHGASLYNKEGLPASPFRTSELY
jgi:sialate O-acetylesterase